MVERVVAASLKIAPRKISALCRVATSDFRVGTYTKTHQFAAFLTMRSYQVIKEQHRDKQKLGLR